MSNFSEMTPMVGGATNGAPILWSAVTDDDRATVYATGYLNDLLIGDKKGRVNTFDLFYFTYSAADPVLRNSAFGYVDESVGNYNLARGTPTTRIIDATYGGGAATFTITASGINLTTTSRVLVQFETQANPSSILTARVSAANTITVVTTANPGVSTLYVLASI